MYHKYLLSKYASWSSLAIGKVNTWWEGITEMDGGYEITTIIQNELEDSRPDKTVIT